MRQAMKQVMISATLIAVSAVPVSAEGDKLCHSMSSVAGSVMMIRQNANVSLSEYLGGFDPKMQNDPIIRAVVIGAWDFPRMTLPKNREQAILDYQNEIMLRCLKEGWE